MDQAFSRWLALSISLSKMFWAGQTKYELDHFNLGGCIWYKPEAMILISSVKVMWRNANLWLNIISYVSSFIYFKRPISSVVCNRSTWLIRTVLSASQLDKVLPFATKVIVSMNDFMHRDVFINIWFLTEVHLCPQLYCRQNSLLHWCKKMLS